jgi:hypothetical protein
MVGGSVVFYARAIDREGNMGESPRAGLTVLADRTAGVTILKPAPNESFLEGMDVAIRAIVNDDERVVTLQTLTRDEVVEESASPAVTTAKCCSPPSRRFPNLQRNAEYRPRGDRHRRTAHGGAGIPC